MTTGPKTKLRPARYKDDFSGQVDMLLSLYVQMQRTIRPEVVLSHAMTTFDIDLIQRETYKQLHREITDNIFGAALRELRELDDLISRSVGHRVAPPLHAQLEKVREQMVFEIDTQNAHMDRI